MRGEVEGIIDGLKKVIDEMENSTDWNKKVEIEKKRVINEQNYMINWGSK